ncbi:DMT family transporter [Hydrogenophaga soli]
MNILMAFIAALAYGVSDFIGGYAARKYPALDIIIISYPISAVLVLLVCPIFGGQLDATSMTWGMSSGVAMAVAIWWFYAALARGPMSIVSPITSVLTAALPVLVGLGLGEPLSSLALAGVILAIGAIALVSWQPTDQSSTLAMPASLLPFTRQVLLLTVGAGTAFALSFMFAHQVPAGAGLWPILMARVSATVLVFLAGRTRLKTLRKTPISLIRYSLLIGILDAIANSAMYFALQGAQLSTTSVLISLYPVFTVLLAVFVIKEAIGRLQYIGMGFAFLAIWSISSAFT